MNLLLIIGAVVVVVIILNWNAIMAKFSPKQVVSVTGAIVGTIASDGKSCLDATGKVIGTVDSAGVVSDVSGNVVGFVQGSAAAIAANAKPAPGASPLPPPPATPPANSFPTAWQCLDGIDTPLRRENNLAKDVSCMSVNGKDCLWGGCAEQIKSHSNNPANIQPLTCGAPHQALYGITGYDTQGHWCDVGANLIPGK